MMQIDKILAEIKRLKKELKDYSATEALDYIESYVNLVAQEQSSLLPNIDEAAKKAVLEVFTGYADLRTPFSEEKIKRVSSIFKAGAEWMAEQVEKDHVLTADDIRLIFEKVSKQSYWFTDVAGAYQPTADWFNKLKQK